MVSEGVLMVICSPWMQVWLSKGAVRSRGRSATPSTRGNAGGEGTLNPPIDQVRQQAGVSDNDEGVLRQLPDQTVPVYENSRVAIYPGEGLSNEEREQMLGIRGARM